MFSHPRFSYPSHLLSARFGSGNDSGHVQESSENVDASVGPMTITDAEWRAAGRWARPTVNGVVVDNIRTFNFILSTCRPCIVLTILYSFSAYSASPPEWSQPRGCVQAPARPRWDRTSQTLGPWPRASKLAPETYRMDAFTTKS